MNTIKNIAEIDDLLPVALDFAHLLSRSDNEDIAVEFPGSVTRYSGAIDTVVQNLQETQHACVPRVRQQFIAYAGDWAVGISAVRFADAVPVGVEPEWPNVSGFICNPYRNRGIGRLSLLERLQVVDEQFGGCAWTKVKKSNVFSHRMVTHAGFVVVGEEAESLVYAYRSTKD